MTESIPHNEKTFNRITLERIEFVLNRCDGVNHHCPILWGEARWMIRKIKRQALEIKKLKKQLSRKESYAKI